MSMSRYWSCEVRANHRTEDIDVFSAAWSAFCAAAGSFGGVAPTLGEGISPEAIGPQEGLRLAMAANKAAYEQEKDSSIGPAAISFELIYGSVWQCRYGTGRTFCELQGGADSSRFTVVVGCHDAEDIPDAIDSIRVRARAAAETAEKAGFVVKYDQIHWSEIR